MRLTQVLWLEMKKWKKHRLPSGHLYQGKHRIVIPPSALEVARLNRELEIEDKNMFYLRHPYLDAEESKSHQASSEYYFNSMIELRRVKMEKFSKPMRLSEHLAHLKNAESWE